MRLTAFILLVGALHISAATLAQRINLNAKNVSVKTVFRQIEQQSGYYFLYDPSVVKGIKRMDVRVSDLSLSEALNKCLDGTGLKYEIVKKSIILSRKETDKISPSKFFTPPLPVHDVLIHVMDSTGLSLQGAVVSVRGIQSENQTDNQ